MLLNNRRRVLWTRDEERRLANLYVTLTAKEVAEKLGRTLKAVTRKLMRLGISLQHKEGVRRRRQGMINNGVSFAGENNPYWKGGISKDASAYTKMLRQKDPAKYAARLALTKALRNGTLTRQPCEVCGNPATDGHHDDYTKPLDVRWLCRKHHGEHHKTHRPNGRAQKTS